MSIYSSKAWSLELNEQCIAYEVNMNYLPPVLTLNISLKSFKIK